MTDTDPGDDPTADPIALAERVRPYFGFGDNEITKAANAVPDPSRIGFGTYVVPDDDDDDQEDEDR